MQLRYRIMPYLYSLAASVHFDDATIMRGLVMDYPDDPEVRDLSDQWMLGPALMVCPVYEYGARSRSVYLPEGGWYDFYTGEYYAGGRRITVEAPYERIPLFVREGSILPYGDAMEWTDEKPAEHITFLVYAGKDASFNFYEDDGLTYDYEKGEYSSFEIRWNDEARIFNLESRKGSFPGMINSRTFCICVVDPENPKPFDPEQMTGNALCITYDGFNTRIGL